MEIFMVQEILEEKSTYGDINRLSVVVMAFGRLTVSGPILPILNICYHSMLSQ